jgi:hypothetical protein
MWVYRANRNARALTVQTMRFTPGRSWREHRASRH